jgi:hypothetical protein
MLELRPRPKNCLALQFVVELSSILIGARYALRGPFSITLYVFVLSLTLAWRDMTDEEMIEAITSTIRKE